MAGLKEMLQAGASYGQIDYWTTAGKLRVDATNPGTGRSRRWLDSEVPVLAVMVRLTAVGLSVDAAERVARAEVFPVELGPGVFVSVEGEGD